MRERLIGPWAAFNEPEDSVTLDVGGLVRRLLLFEHITLESSRLREFPQLVAAFGYDGVRELLTSGVMGVYCDAVVVGQVGQDSGSAWRAAKGLLPLGSYSFAVLVPHDRQAYLHGCFIDIEGAIGIGDSKARKLKGLIAKRFTEPLVDGGATLDGLEADLAANHPVVGDSVALALGRLVGKEVSREDFSLKVERIDETDFRTETDIGTRFGLDGEEVHRLVERGLLGVGGMNRRIEQMKAFNAVSGLVDDELPIFQSKLGFLAEQLDPRAQEARFERVLRVADLPLPDERATDVDLARVLEIRNSDECREMRQWLRSIDTWTDEELHDSFHRVREQLARTFHGGVGRAARFAIGTGLSLIPAVGLPAGAGFSAIDNFLLDEVIPKPGPYSFLSRQYPSIFTGA